MNILEKLWYHTWNIGFVESDVQNIVASDAERVDVHWVKHSYKDRFFADPFILSLDAAVIKVLVEDFPYYDKRGMISLLTIDRKTYELLDKEIILKQPFHMSFPFIMRQGHGKIWVAPEASKSGKLYRYALNPETGLLGNQEVLVPEPLLDPSIVEYNGLWWLFCTKRGPKSNKELYIYYAEVPEGPWMPHLKNPVVEDAAMARPAGSFVKDGGGNLYRIIQKCDMRYGECVNVSRVEVLTTTEFKETFVKEVKAQEDEYRFGFHTMNGLDGLTVVDGLKKQFAPFRRVAYEMLNFISRIRERACK